MMNARETRKAFLDFFEKKQHLIVPSAPMVNKNDPTLMFTNAGMNQFKDFFLGNQQPKSLRIADTQKCLRVSGKHNDLEEVGRDSYHHTMFEMLGNWSFGDYFKEDAISWAWELLTEVYDLPQERLYVTVFGGDKEDQLERDDEAAELWQKFIPKERILSFDKKDNFWEMGETGPCGPCSEIHIDLRDESKLTEKPGADLVNMDDPEVIELWNLVFIQFNRKSDRSLEALPAKHVDTGMGFERLCMVNEGKKFSYDSSVFAPLIQFVEKESGKKYTSDYSGQSQSDIAMRVIVDHIRAVSFGIADGELPSNTGAGYVLRRILRRAVRYYYSFLDVHEPFLYRIVPLLSDFFTDVFPSLPQQEGFIAKVIQEEEKSFLRTLESGLKRFEVLEINDNCISGQDAFELYDTYGFPFDLTSLLAEEKGLQVDEASFKKALAAQKDRSRADAKKSLGDWNELSAQKDTEFVGYDQLIVSDSKVSKYRLVEHKGKERYHLVLTKTPFYPEGGGQVGDTGTLTFGAEKISVINTIKENDLPIHVVEKLPKDIDSNIIAVVRADKRKLTEHNHSATHLVHAALRKVLGEHVHQKGSLVNAAHLRFDFSHFQKMSDDEIKKVEHLVNQKIRENILRKEDRSIPIAKAKESGAMMLFGEKYGDKVRMITFDPEYSVELCGGCHVQSTGELGMFKIVSESAVAAGVRRIEAITSTATEKYIDDRLGSLREIKDLLKNPKDISSAVSGMIEENKSLRKEIEKLNAQKAGGLKDELMEKVSKQGDMHVLASRVPITDSKALKTLAYEIEQSLGSGAFILFGTESDGKAQLMLTLSKDLVEKGFHAGNVIRELSKEISGGGGGQPFFATAGGSDPSGLDRALARVSEFLEI